MLEPRKDRKLYMCKPKVVIASATPCDDLVLRLRGIYTLALKHSEGKEAVNEPYEEEKIK